MRRRLKNEAGTVQKESQTATEDYLVGTFFYTRVLLGEGGGFNCPPLSCRKCEIVIS